MLALLVENGPFLIPEGKTDPIINKYGTSCTYAVFVTLSTFFVCAFYCTYLFTTVQFHLHVHTFLGWNSFANLLYVDQPVGTGFSYVRNPLGYETNERTIGKELWAMLLGFYKKYPKYANLDLYIVGESYGKEKGHSPILQFVLFY